jgi:hypothetical protein
MKRQSAYEDLTESLLNDIAASPVVMAVSKTNKILAVE